MISDKKDDIRLIHDIKISLYTIRSAICHIPENIQRISVRK